MVGSGGITKIAEMICGDEPFNYFPYRSSYKLTQFFNNLGLPYKHDGSTRRIWVAEILKKMNDIPSYDTRLPSKELIKIMEELLDPSHFLFDPKLDHDKAVNTLKECIEIYGLTVSLDKKRRASIIINHEESENSFEIDTNYPLNPTVFKKPKKEINQKQISVMMPFGHHFNGTYAAIKKATDYMKLECYRADDLWVNSTFIQDIFDLIYTSKIVIVDFTGRNSNVMYETGIAHTLGKIVIPITQSLEDIPSDLGHHRALKYLPNQEGLKDLSRGLYKKLSLTLNP